MPDLTAKRRNALTSASFAGPDRSYPIPDKPHAANAKARATQMEEKGKISAGTKDRVDAKANKVLNRGK
jgi:hypothetical protein